VHELLELLEHEGHTLWTHLEIFLVMQIIRKISYKKGHPDRKCFWEKVPFVEKHLPLLFTVLF
jgi:hypothetical protein